MATTKICPQKKANLEGSITLLSGAICEWFLILLLFVDSTFSFILRRFAEYCELPTPCIFCTRVSGKRKFEYYNALLCRAHREEISSLVSCHAHGKLTDVQEMCEECVMPMQDKLKSGSYIVGKLGAANIEKHSIQNLILHKKILPNSSGPRICPCCNRSWGAKLNAQTLFKLTPVGLGASKANVKPPLPRVRACSRFSRKNSFKKLSGMLEAPAIPQVEGKSLRNALSHVGYTELQVTSDSESEVNFSDEEERVIEIRGRNDRNIEHDSQYVVKTRLKSETDDVVLEKHSNQNFADVTSLLDLHMQLETDKPLLTHGLEELNWEKPRPSANILVSPDLNLSDDVIKALSNDIFTTVKPQPHILGVAMPDELIPLVNTPPCSDTKNQETLESHDEDDDMTLAQQQIDSPVFMDGGDLYVLNAISSTNTSAMIDETKEVSTTSVEQPSASGSIKFENIKSVTQQSTPRQDDSQNVGEFGSDLNHVQALASLETNESSLKLVERVSIPGGSAIIENVKSVIQQSTPEQNDSRDIGEPSSDLNHVKALASLETNESSLKLAERVSIHSGSTVLENAKSVIQQPSLEQDGSQNVGESSSDLNHVKVLASLETNESSLKLAERVNIPSGSAVFENVKSVIQLSAPEQDDSQNVGEPSSDFNHVQASLERNDSSLKFAERVSISSGSTKFEDAKSVIQCPALEKDDPQNVGGSSSDFNHVKVLALLERNVSSLKLAERVCLSSGSTKFEDNKLVIQQYAQEQDEIQNIDDPSSNGNHLQSLPSLERNDSSSKFSERVSLIDIEGECSIDMLKSQIEYDRKCMNDLYKELEEERNASTIAANQAMAMITRLQEEKAQLHMEALQYLRMMDEQAEYDMEALQKANDDLTEKEKELQDLEYELELYKNNIHGHGGSPVPHPHRERINTIAKNTAEDLCVHHNESSMCEPSSPISSKISFADEVSGNVNSSMSHLDEEKL